VFKHVNSHSLFDQIPFRANVIEPSRGHLQALGQLVMQKATHSFRSLNVRACKGRHQIQILMGNMPVWQLPSKILLTSLPRDPKWPQAIGHGWVCWRRQIWPIPMIQVVQHLVQTTLDLPNFRDRPRKQACTWHDIRFPSNVHAMLCSLVLLLTKTQSGARTQKQCWVPTLLNSVLPKGANGVRQCLLGQPAAGPLGDLTQQIQAVSVDTLVLHQLNQVAEGVKLRRHQSRN
jgi:hypothetical protein